MRVSKHGGGHPISGSPEIGTISEAGKRRRETTATTFPLPNFRRPAHAATALNVMRPPSFDLPRRGRTVISTS